jgi:hypothetical protein
MLQEKLSSIAHLFTCQVLDAEQAAEACKIAIRQHEQVGIMTEKGDE